MPMTKDQEKEKERELEKQLDLDKWIREVHDIVSSLADKLDDLIGKDKVESLPADVKALLVSLKETLGVGGYPYPYARGPYPYPYARKSGEKDTGTQEQVKEEQASEPAQNKTTQPAETANPEPVKEKEESISKEVEERLVQLIDTLAAQIEQLTKILGGPEG